MPADGVPLSPKCSLLSTDEVVRLARLFVQQGVTKIRLTGGEPTVRKDLLDVIAGLDELRPLGLAAIGMTTNGVALKRKLPALLASGLDQLNISLDTLDPVRFEQMTRRKGLDAVLDSIRAAVDMPFLAVKLNAVVIKGTNDDELAGFVRMTRDLPLYVRFIEYMPFDGNKWNKETFLPYKDMLARIAAEFPSITKTADDPNDTSKSYQVDGFRGRFGFITSMSEHFCGTCNRLRLLADGNMKVCLFGNAEVNLRDAMRRGASDDELVQLVNLAVHRKKKQHAGMFELARMPNRPMILIGGLTHVGEDGRASMVDVSDKTETKRTAVAAGRVLLGRVAFELVRDNKSSKGDVLTVAQIAGIQAAKQTDLLIPLCHPLMLSKIGVHLELDEEAHAVDIRAQVTCTGKTGVEMEALVAVSVAACTVYDMCKAVDKGIIITDVRLVSKTGGKSGDFSADALQDR
nr:Molybdenum cofactor synthesis protein 1 [Polyrhizophydium stewartii]